MAVLGCGEYEVFVCARGGDEVLFQLDRLTFLRWDRRRDDISEAHVRVASAAKCCGDLGSLRTGLHELRIVRNGQVVWVGPFVRLEYDRDEVNVFASDVLWVAKNTALATGYNRAFPNIAACGWVMNWLLSEQTYKKNGDPWNVLGNTKWVKGPDEPKTTAAVKAFSTTTWGDFDRFAEDRGMDYTVHIRDIYFWDTHFIWRRLPPIDETYLSSKLAVVEYGNELFTRVIVTNGNGHAAVRQSREGVKKYGYLDKIIVVPNESAATGKPTKEELAAWGEQAEAMLRVAYPAPVRVRVPEGSTLSPDLPIGINDLVAGSWVNFSSTRLCRPIVGLHKIDKVTVVFDGREGEKVQLSTLEAPVNSVGGD